MAVKKTELLTKTELTSVLNRQNCNSIGLFEKVNLKLVGLHVETSKQPLNRRVTPSSGRESLEKSGFGAYS